MLPELDIYFVLCIYLQMWKESRGGKNEIQMWKKIPQNIASTDSKCLMGMALFCTTTSKHFKQGKNWSLSMNIYCADHVWWFWPLWYLGECSCPPMPIHLGVNCCEYSSMIASRTSTGFLLSVSATSRYGSTISRHFVKAFHYIHTLFPCNWRA